MSLIPRGALAAALATAVLTLAVAGPVAAASPSPKPSPAALSARQVSAGSGPLSVSVVVPITVSPSPDSSGLIDADHLRSYTAPTGILTRQLNAVIDTPAVIALDPMILASIQVLGTSAPPTAQAWLLQLRQASNEIFPLAYADADPAVLAKSAGGLGLLSSLDFSFAINPSDFGPAQTATPSSSSVPLPTPSATVPSGTPPPLPSSDDLVSWPYTATGIAWPADDTVVHDDLAPLAAAGFHDVLLDSQNISAADSALVDLNGIDGLISDSGISSLVREAAYASDDDAFASALSRLDAALQGEQAVSPGRTVIAALDRRWPIGALRIREVLANIEGQESAQLVGLSQVLDGPKSAAQVVDEPLTIAGSSLAQDAIATVPAETAFATVAGDGAAKVTAPRHLELLSALAVSWLREDSGWRERLQKYLADSRTILRSVQIVHGSDLLVSANSTNIPVTVSNALKVPVTLNVAVSANSAILQINKPQVKLTIEPGSSNKALVPAQALSNGSISVSVSLTSAADPSVHVGGVDVMDVDLQPGWEGIGTLIVVVLLVLIFGGGILRNVLKRRAARRSPSDEAHD